MNFTKKSKKVEMLEVAESQIRQWFQHVRADVLNDVLSGISQHIEKSENFKKGRSLSIRFDQHPPKWLREIYIKEHISIDYSAISGIRQIHLDFNELTVDCQVAPGETKNIYDGYRRKSVPL
jgi:hypothetical protein